MVYVTRDGKVLSHQPWGIPRMYSILVRLVMALMFFFRSLIDPILSNFNAGASADRRSFFGFGRGSGGGGGGGDDRGPPRPPRRPMGRITHLSDVTVPGGCAGGNCGR